MNNFRRENNLTHTEPIENLPPTLAFTTVVLGGFRGLIANVLWVRAMQMQEDGKFFEMAQLGDWITKLQPYADHVWRVTAWNMSYNISVKFDGIENKLKSSNIKNVWIAGRQIMKNRKILTVAEDKIYTKFRSIKKQVIKHEY